MCVRPPRSIDLARSALPRGPINSKNGARPLQQLRTRMAIEEEGHQEKGLRERQASEAI